MQGWFFPLLGVLNKPNRIGALWHYRKIVANLRIPQKVLIKSYVGFDMFSLFVQFYNVGVS